MSFLLLDGGEMAHASLYPWAVMLHADLAYVVGFLFGLVTLGFATCLLLDCGLLDHLPLGQLGQSLPQPET